MIIKIMYIHILTYYLLYCSYQESPSTAELDSANCRRTLEDTVVLSPNALKALLTECLNSWVNYLQVSIMCFNNRELTALFFTVRKNEPPFDLTPNYVISNVIKWNMD